FAKEYLALNPLGTIPFMIDGETRMTESSGICHYLGTRYGPTPLMVGADEPAEDPFGIIAQAETLCAGRFTAADIVIGYALRLADNIGLAKDFGPNVAAYWQRLQARDGYKRAVAAEILAGEQQQVARRP